jgi:hypothetical protein
MNADVLQGTDRRRVVTIVVAAMLALLVVAALWFWFAGRAVSPQTIEGWAVPNAAGTAISLHASRDGGPGEGYIVAGAWWRGVDEVWHDGADVPTCIGTDTTALTHVRLGVVKVQNQDGMAWNQVPWLECLE